MSGSFAGISSVLLQWSHDLSAMDTSSSEGTEKLRRLLQWSHDLSAMDTLVFDEIGESYDAASMEP